MRVTVALGCAFLLATAAGAKALKIIQPLPADLVGQEAIADVAVTVSEPARKTFDALEAKAADKKARGIGAAAGAAPEEAYAALPFREMFARVVADELRDWQVKGSRPVRLSLQVDTLKTADAGMAMLLGSNDELAGIVSVLDAASGRQLGEFYVDVLNTRAGLLGLAMRGAGVREKLAREFAGHVAVALTGRKSKGSTALAATARPGTPAATTKLIAYPIAPDILAKTPEQIGLAPSPAPARGPADIRLVASQAADHEVTRTSMMEGGASLTNPVSALVRQLAEAEDRDGRLDDGDAAGTITVWLDRAATLTRCVTTGELQGTCLVRSTLVGSARRAGEAAPRPVEVVLEKSVRGLMMSHAVALVSREAALRFLHEATAG